MEAKKKGNKKRKESLEHFSIHLSTYLQCNAKNNIQDSLAYLMKCITSFSSRVWVAIQKTLIPMTFRKT